jgi:AcrR family transcriptional regulator
MGGGGDMSHRGGLITASVFTVAVMTASAVVRIWLMARWPPGTRDRLEQSGLELFADQGYDRTTVAQIADRAGLKERSFYRYFPDKREVLFAGGKDLEDRLAEEIASLPNDLTPLEVLLTALPAAGDVLRPRDFVRRRRAVIEASPALAERELIKLANLSEVLTATLAARGADRQTAELCVSIGMAVLRQAGQQWVEEDAEYTDLVHRITRDLVNLVVAYSGASQASPGPEASGSRR